MKPFTPALVATAVCLAACGGSTSSSHSGSHPALSQSALTRPTHVYLLRLSGGAATPPGAPLGRGDAIVAFHGQSALCWRFAHLHGFTQAASAQIHAGRPGRTGVAVVSLSTGSKLHHHGCVSITPTLATAIVHGPNGYYVTIPRARYPAGAVRAQL
jgi:hypothetical protein